MTLYRIACHGLGVVQPIDVVAAELSAQTPNEPRFVIVGGFDPRIEEIAIENEMRRAVTAGAAIVYIGHSLGAALGFYLAKRNPQWKFSTMITVDPTSWGSNIGDDPEWATTPKEPGRWEAMGTYDRWLNIRTQMYPGGGALVNQSEKATDHFFPTLDHIGVILDPRVRAIIDTAVKEAST